ncbi:hypothetical protein DFP94_1011448 [Fontibacillus phaseoli]|uniref:Uncharacterized protein n=1 Tax=Fontibacillus phaseoli TaxID=1416533 RepID=A0A369BW28_9BACL|nr:hypothetical protein [Fontibacillus phaseoli]RCX23844.1 hypothetical protein DFP94_1011448 [Fontibacillus phaseoli]
MRLFFISITGGTSSIGIVMAMAFVKESATVAIADLNEELGGPRVIAATPGTVPYDFGSRFIEAIAQQRDGNQKK